MGKCSLHVGERLSPMSQPAARQTAFPDAHNATIKLLTGTFAMAFAEGARALCDDGTFGDQAGVSPPKRHLLPSAH